MTQFFRYLYSILFYCVLPFAFLRLLWRSGPQPAYRQGWNERMGFYQDRLDKSIWVHAVSLGETIAATPLIEALIKAYPGLSIVVTNMTITGSERTRLTFGDSVLQRYIPYDVPCAVNRFLSAFKPVIGVIMETELWPNLMAGCHQKNIPVVIANARLSHQSAKRYGRVSLITREMLSSLSYIAAQDSPAMERFIALGIDPKKISVTGNLKFDLELPADLSAKTDKLRLEMGSDRLIWVAASTHPTEEEIILAAHAQVLEKNPHSLLILVPRHPERFDLMAALIEQEGFKMARRSHGDLCLFDTQVYLGDTMGELLSLYAVANVAFVAGSFAQIGGHNMLEPAALHKPVLTGPVLFNFAEISQWMIQAKGMVVVHSADELSVTVNGLLSDPVAREAMGECAYSVIEKNRGALKKQLDIIQERIVI